MDRYSRFTGNPCNVPYTTPNTIEIVKVIGIVCNNLLFIFLIFNFSP